ncbi:MAG: hypothetical protein U5K74_15630 [Gemmatimonadaceae bacterium]|nr:hypothetical protein [Gemmatimonadaceae bacterium]
MSTLHVHSLSESLGTLWPTLASQLGLDSFITTTDATASIMHGVLIVAAAGDEARLPEVLRHSRIFAWGTTAGGRRSTPFALAHDILWRSAAEMIDGGDACRRQVGADAQQHRHRFDGVYGDSPAIGTAERAIRTTS